MTEIARELMSRQHFLEMLGISDSNERRRRKTSPAWPPHLRIGKKVYYRKSAVETYLRQLERLSSGATSEGDPGLTDVEGAESGAETTSGNARRRAATTGREG